MPMTPPRRGLLILIGLLTGAIAFGSCTQTKTNHPINENKDTTMSNPADRSEQQWKESLTREQFQILRKKGTEKAFTGAYWNTKEKGTYLCSACGNALFSSETKYDSGSGWPSFWEPVEKERIGFHEDKSLFSSRIEVTCSHCDSHLGHVFDDGPQPTGKRYCINSASLKLKPTEPQAGE